MKFYYFNSTHWDREWYQPFQEFRKYLVDTTRVLLEIFERDPDYRRFTFDGQTIVLEDICEIRPDWRPKLEALIRAGKLNVGPWYVMPDEFLVSGEALIRNLLTGKKVAEEFGHAPWPVGYVCDIFGHIAQLPQILAGFQLKGSVAWRGTEDKGGEHLLWWEAPDGTRLPHVNLGKWCGYSEFTFDVRGNHSAEPLDEQTFKTRLREYVERDRNRWNSCFILSDGFDHACPSPDTSKMLRWIQEAYPDAEVIHTDYTELFDHEFGCAERPVIRSEQIQPACHADHNGWQISATLSSRYDVKQGNDLCQNELELLLDPAFAAFAAAGKTEQLPILNYQWKHLLQNHAHDSICGCSIDRVHRQILSRFEEVRDIGRTLVKEIQTTDRAALLKPGVADPNRAASDGCYTLRLYNPLPFELDEIREVELVFPADTAYPKRQAEPFGYEFFNSFRLYDEQGGEIVYQLKSIRRNQTCSFHRQDARSCDLYMVAFRTRLRAAGWTTVRLRPSEDVVRSFATLAVGPASADNGLLRLDINPDGTFDLTDRRSGRAYRRLNDYRIDREIGDGWNHVRPVGNRRIAAASRAQTALVCDGPERIQFEITRQYEVPQELEFAGTIHESYAGIRESRESATLEIVTTVTLDRNSERVGMHTVVHNNVRDYRLQLLLPTGIAGGGFAEQAFACLERPDGRTHGTLSEPWPEPEMVEKNFAGIIGKRDAAGGIAFLSRAGLHEAGFLEDENRSIAVTLLRAFRRTVQTDGETDGQLPGDREFDYALDLFPAERTFAELVRAEQKLRLDLPSYLIASELVESRPDQSFFTLSGELVYSALKPAEDGKPGSAVLRLCNPTARPASGELGFAAPPRRIALCRLDETEIEEVSGLNLTLRPGEIRTLRLEWE